MKCDVQLLKKILYLTWSQRNRKVSDETHQETRHHATNGCCSDVLLLNLLQTFLITWPKNTLSIRAMVTHMYGSEVEWIKPKELEETNSPPSSPGTQGPPESARIRGLTARMYAIVRKVAVAPASSVVNEDPRSWRSKQGGMKIHSGNHFHSTERWPIFQTHLQLEELSNKGIADGIIQVFDELHSILLYCWFREMIVINWLILLIMLFSQHIDAQFMTFNAMRKGMIKRNLLSSSQTNAQPWRKFMSLSWKMKELMKNFGTFGWKCWRRSNNRTFTSMWEGYTASRYHELLI